ncbi:MAG: hypothetical protein WCA80_11810, partial [Candidatus Aquilonibacter sp.]
MFHALVLAAIVAASPSPSVSPSPTPTASPTPTPPYSLHGAFSLYTEHTNYVNPTETDLSNALLTFSKNTGQLQGSVTVGPYAFPVVGQ